MTVLYLALCILILLKLSLPSFLRCLDEKERYKRWCKGSLSKVWLLFQELEQFHDQETSFTGLILFTYRFDENCPAFFFFMNQSIQSNIVEVLAPSEGARKGKEEFYIQTHKI